MALINFLVTQPFLAYLIIFLGVTIEGEGIILLASVFAAQGHLSWFWLAVSAISGTIVGDLFWFEMGRHLKGTKLGGWLDRRYEKTGEWLNDWIVSRYHWYAVVSKFMYFTNRPTIFLAGWHNFDQKKFFKITIYATLIWAAIILGLGYLFGLTVGLIGFKKILHRITYFAIGLFVVLFLIEWGINKLVRRKTRSFRNQPK